MWIINLNKHMQFKNPLSLLYQSTLCWIYKLKGMFMTVQSTCQLYLILIRIELDLSENKFL